MKNIYLEIASNIISFVGLIISCFTLCKAGRIKKAISVFRKDILFKTSRCEDYLNSINESCNKLLIEIDKITSDYDDSNLKNILNKLIPDFKGLERVIPKDFDRQCNAICKQLIRIEKTQITNDSSVGRKKFSIKTLHFESITTKKEIWSLYRTIVRLTQEVGDIRRDNKVL